MKECDWVKQDTPVRKPGSLIRRSNLQAAEQSTLPIEIGHPLKSRIRLTGIPSLHAATPGCSQNPWFYWLLPDLPLSFLNLAFGGFSKRKWKNTHIQRRMCRLLKTPKSSI